jgi:hypothetical protein
MADFFAWDPTFVSKLLNGHRIPGLVNATKIERLTGIPTEAWLSSETDTDAPKSPVKSLSDGQ